MRSVARLVAQNYAALIVLAIVTGLAIAACTKDGPTIPDPVVEAPTAPTAQTVTPTVVAAPGGTGSSWTQHGVTVTVVADEWGPGACHTNGGARTLRIENRSEIMRYSRPAGFSDPGLTCATQHTPTGSPRIDTTCPVGPNGEYQVPAGATCEATYHVTIPKCGSYQGDDSLGPGPAITEGVFVIGDAFKSTKTCDGCVEDPTTTTETECGPWNECHEHPQASSGDTPAECFQERECVETTTVDYRCKADETTERPFEETRPCDCECVPEWSEWELIGTECGEWGECRKIEAQALETSPGSWQSMPGLTGELVASHGGKKCDQGRECVSTYQRTEKCTKETETRTETETERQPCDCPEPEGICHVSNKGGRDGQVNLVLSPKKWPASLGHLGHLDASKFCPPDHRGACSCPQAKADAIACGIEATGGFVCKIEGGG